MTVDICPCFLEGHVQVSVTEKSAPPCDDPSSDGKFTTLRKIRIRVDDGWECWELKDVECTGTASGGSTITDTYSILHLFADSGDGWKECASSMLGASFDMGGGCGADTSGADRPFDSVRLQTERGYDWTTTGIRLVFSRSVNGLLMDSAGKLWMDDGGKLYRG